MTRIERASGTGFPGACLRGLLILLIGASLWGAARPATAHWPASPLAVDLYDRTTGGALAVHPKDGQRYVIGTPGHEYAIRLRNNSGQRVLAVTSVDGVNVVTGDTASPEQSGYVIDAWGSVEIAGWRTSLERTAAFYFTDLSDSYAARTGRPANVGVIGVAVYRERPPAVAERSLRDRIAAHDGAKQERGDVPAAPMAAHDGAKQERGDVPAAPMAAPRREADRQAADATAAPPAEREARTLSSKLGTGFGRDETSPAQRVRFDRATAAPVETVAIRYDRRENLIAMGVLPSPRYAQRTPDPFPAMRFVPAPR